jgi:hypothetical protein
VPAQENTEKGANQTDNGYDDRSNEVGAGHWG